MKTILLFLATFFCTTLYVLSQNVIIPDINFKNALLAPPNHGIDTNGDGEIQVSEAIAYTGPIDVSSKNISDLTGIESFINITILACPDNQLTELNLINNTKLEMLFCMYNNLTKLYLNNMPDINTFYAYNNNLEIINIANGNNLNISAFNVINNPDLQCIQIDNGFTPPTNWVKNSSASYSYYICAIASDSALPGKTFAKSSSNQFVYFPDANFKNALLNHTPIIDVNNNGEIDITEAQSTLYINVGYNGINDLTGIEAFVNLEALACAGNNLPTISLPYNSNLDFLYCAGSNVEKLYLQYNTKLENLSAWNNNLKTVNVANGNNTILTTFDVSNNPNLGCIQIDRGFRPPSNWITDNTRVYSYYICPEIAISVLPGRTVALKNPELKNTIINTEVFIYPNPSSDFINLKNTKDVSSIEIFDLSGKEIFKTVNPKEQINISTYKTGMYMMKITSGDEFIIKKLIKK